MPGSVAGGTTRSTRYLVQYNNTGFCGVAGCVLKLFIMQTNGEFDQALGADGKIGALAEVEVLKTSRMVTITSARHGPMAGHIRFIGGEAHDILQTEFANLGTKNQWAQIDRFLGAN
jgi:hypothetical protein